MSDRGEFRHRRAASMIAGSAEGVASFAGMRRSWSISGLVRVPVGLSAWRIGNAVDGCCD
jgi:hypothetical protein